MITVLLALTLQVTPARLEQLARDGWQQARAAALTGGAADAIAPARATLAILDEQSVGTPWLVHGHYAHELIAAAIAAAMDERGEMELHLAQARTLAERLATSAYPAEWPRAIDEAEGELYFEVDQYDDAARAFRRASQRKGAVRPLLGLARSAARLGDTAVACEAYRQWLTLANGAPEVNEAGSYLSRCP